MWWDLALDFLIEFAKIFGTMIGLSFLISFLQTFIPFKKFLEKAFKKNNILSLIFAIGLGFLSPFCSCTIIPVVIILLQTGVPLCLTLVFFTSAALLNITSLISLFTFMPYNFVLIYIGIAVLICVVLYLAFLKQKDYKKEKAFAALEVNPAIVYNDCHCKCEHCNHDEHEELNHNETEKIEERLAKDEYKDKKHKYHTAFSMQAEDCKTFKTKVVFSLKRTRDILKDTWLFLLIALVIAVALEFVLDNYSDAVVPFVSGNLFLTNIILNVVGAVIHGEVIALIPIIQQFIVKLPTISIVSLVAFLGISTVISIPLSITLFKYIKLKNILVYNSIVFVFYLSLGLIGMLF